MFTEQEKTEFKPYMKKKFDKELSIDNAMIAAYLDMCRGPLNGINECIEKHNPDYTSTKVRDKFIKEIFISRVNDLVNNEEDYDDWHKKTSDEIINFYKNYGYYDMTYGKAQKWINMSIKYIMLYTISYQETLLKYRDKFHVPIDRYIAPSIAELIGFLPSDDGNRKLNNLDKSFDAYKMNYCWSNINDYDDYLHCQKAIRNSLNIPPLNWEFIEWKKEKENRKN